MLGGVRLALMCLFVQREKVVVAGKSSEEGQVVQLRSQQTTLLYTDCQVRMIKMHLKWKQYIYTYPLSEHLPSSISITYDTMNALT
jgi:hypothetical protein